MARRRMLDPEFFFDEELASTENSAYVRLFYEGLWVHCDDTHHTIPKKLGWLKAQIFPYEQIDVEKLWDELVRVGKIKEFMDETGGEWGYIKNFSKYQRVDKPSASKFPPFPGVLQEDSKRTPAKVKLSKEKGSKVNIERTALVESKSNPDIRPFGETWLRTCTAIQGITPVVDWAKCNALLKKRLGHEGMTRERLEMLAIWFLSQKKRYQDSKGNWQEKFKNTPDLAVMLSSARFNELLSDERNAMSFFMDNLEWADRIYKKARPVETWSNGMTSIRDLIGKFSLSSTS